MKKGIILAAAMLLMGFAGQAQNYMVVNTEKVFKSITAYNNALESLEQTGKQYQQRIDQEYAAIEKMYNDYQAEKAYLSVASRNAREQAILTKEQAVIEYQEQVFGQEGDLMKRRVELIKPIQDRVFAAINTYAQQNGFALAIDIATNPTILYYAPTADKTDDIINLVR